MKRKGKIEIKEKFLFCKSSKGTISLVNYEASNCDISDNISPFGTKQLTVKMDSRETMYFDNPDGSFLPVFRTKDDKSALRFKYFKFLLYYYSKLINLNNKENLKNYDEDLVKSVQTAGYLYSKYNEFKTPNKDSFLDNYLNDCKVDVIDSKDKLIFPFQSNYSQIIAVQNALSSNVSIIEGPPGTGKTQVILNIVANLVCRGKRVGLVSNNNSAVENIIQKLDKMNLAFYCARLGSKDEIKKFIGNFNSIEDSINKFPHTKEDVKSVKFNFKKNLQKLMRCYQIEKEEAKLKTLLADLNAEKRQYTLRFNVKEQEITEETNKKVDILKECEKFVILLKNDNKPIHNKKNWNMKAKDKLKLRKYFNIEYVEIKENVSIVINNLEWISLSYKIKRIEKEIELKKDELNNLGFDDLKIDYESNSMIYFKNALINKLNGDFGKLVSEENKKEGWEKNFPVILSTISSLANCVNDDDLLDYLVIDESSQAELLSSVFALSHTRNIIIVGDSKQLPQICEDKLSPISGKISETFYESITAGYKYESNSILSSIKQNFPTAPSVTLVEHYRCHPGIINFCNSRFYNNELVTLTKNFSIDSPFKVIILENEEKQEDYGENKKGFKNETEAKAIISDIASTYNLKKIESLAVIAPYKSQANCVKSLIVEDLKDKILADTVHSFQGQEKDHIYISFTRDFKSDRILSHRSLDFINNENLLNVAISRAVKKLTIVVSGTASRMKFLLINDLISYIGYYYPESVFNYPPVSIFDSLYSKDVTMLIKLAKQARLKLLDSPAELLFYRALEEVIESEFDLLSVGFHVPVSNLITKRDALNEEQIKYINNPWTHVDFLVYQNSNKQPIIAFEVDGSKFHKPGSDQEKRDIMKDAVFKLNDLNLVRYKTKRSKDERNSMIKEIKESFEKIKNSKVEAISEC